MGAFRDCRAAKQNGILWRKFPNLRASWKRKLETCAIKGSGRRALCNVSLSAGLRRRRSLVPEKARSLQMAERIAAGPKSNALDASKLSTRSEQ